jgi:carboxyl-terminal processing protease
MTRSVLFKTISLFVALGAVACQSPPPLASALPPADSSTSEGRYVDVAVAVGEAMRRWHYNPAELGTDGYKAMEARAMLLANTEGSPEDFAKAFTAAWRKDGPFSHVRMDVARSSAAETAAYLDGMKVGGTGAKLNWKENVAILTVDTMMGSDTIDQINAAFDEIARNTPKALVIDLRENEGGAFAGIPLLGHVIDKPFDAGAFVSQAWARENKRPPVASDLKEVAPWTGWSLTTFWRDAQDNRLTRIQFQPMTPHYAGPVYVLTSGTTASAAEMTADAFRTSGRATLIGERTKGAMLSQKIYDLPQGLQLSLPIADYYSVRIGRIEGTGVAPDVAVPAAEALDVALQMLASN